MFEYHLFIIKEKNLYKSFDLYNILYELSTMRECLNYGVSLYKQLCIPFRTSILSNYLNDRYNLSRKKVFYIENSIVILKPSRIIIKSNHYMPNIIKIFNLYNRNIFVCDFKSENYFWLNDSIKIKINEYIWLNNINLVQLYRKVIEC